MYDAPIDRRMLGNTWLRAILVASIAWAVGVVATPATGQVAFAPVFTDHMVVQRDGEVTIWGSAAPGAPVTVTFEGIEVDTAANDSGVWLATLPAMEANATGLLLTARSGADTASITNVLIGDVWICVGQSNMEWPISRDADRGETLAHADHPQIRLFQAEYTGSGAGGVFDSEIVQRLNADDFLQGRWTLCDEETLRSMSAVGFYFGLALNMEMDVPIGLIDLAAGGTPTEAWISSATLAADARTASLVQSGNWLDNPELGEWCRQRAGENLSRALKSGEPIPGDDVGPNHAFKPGFMWSTAAEPFTMFSIRGVIWYQGESNAESPERVAQHGVLFPMLVRDWRRHWRDESLPFFYVQLPAMGRPDWPEFREQQRGFLDVIDNIGMAVTIDVGHPTNVHPVNKRPVGDRLARLALARVHGVDILESGPMVSRALREDKILVLEFDNTGSGLATSDGSPPCGFESIQRDGTLLTVHARVEGKTIRLKLTDHLDVVEIRYAWAPTPVCNLVNREGLPASPFRITVGQ